MAVNVGELVAVLRLKDEMSGSLKGAIGGLVSAGASMLSFGAAVAFVGKALKAQGESEAAINKLNLALANTGRYSKETSASLTDLAASLQDTTTYADEAVLSAEAVLASFGMTREEIERTTKAAVDFSAATGADLTASANLLGKAFAGSTGALGRYGIVVDENLSKSQKFEAAIGQLEQRFGGSAAAATQTYQGQLAQLGNAFDDVFEASGKFLGYITSNGESAFSGMLTAVKAVSSFISSDLVIAFSEARARVSELLAWGHEQMAKLGGTWVGQKLGIDPAAEKLAAADLRAFAQAQREQGDAAAAAAGKTIAVTNATKVYTPTVSDATKATDEWKKQLDAISAGMGEFYDQLAQRRGAREDMMGLLGPSAQDATIEMGRLADVTERFGGVAALSDAQLVTLVNNLREQAKLGGENAFGFEALSAAMDEAASRSDHVWSQVGGAIEKTGKVTETVTTKTYDWNRALQTIANIAQSLGGTFGSIFGSIASGVSGIGSVLQNSGGLGGLLKSFSGGFSGILSGVGGVASIVSAAMPMLKSVGSWIGGLFGNKAKKELKEAKSAVEDFIKGSGGLEALKKHASEAGVSLDKLFAAKNKGQASAAIDEITGKLGAWDDAQQAVNDAMERYGLTVEEMGPAFARQKLDEQCAQLLQDYNVLIAAGADVNAVIAKMGPNLNEYVNAARSAGQAIPMAMKPVIDQLVASGQLLDENGQAFASTEAAGITFTESLTDGLSRAIDAINRLVEALGGVPAAVPEVNIPVRYDYPSGGGPPDRYGPPEEYASGYNTPDYYAAGGFEGWVRRPTTIMAGESGPEYVSITPKGSAPAGGGAQVTFAPSFHNDSLASNQARADLAKFQVAEFMRQARNSPMIRQILRENGAR